MKDTSRLEKNHIVLLLRAVGVERGAHQGSRASDRRDGQSDRMSRKS